MLDYRSVGTSRLVISSTFTGIAPSRHTDLVEVGSDMTDFCDRETIGKGIFLGKNRSQRCRLINEYVV